MRASAWLGAPYALRGETPAGWDCLGAVKWLRGELFGRPTPWGPELYTPADADDPERRHALVEAQLPGWTAVEPRPGAVVLFERLGRLDHVGLLLTPRLFIHALSVETGTAITDLRGPWLRRLRGAYDC